MKEDVVIVSDLHLDFWSKKEGGDFQSQTKKLIWEEFIENIKNSTKLLAINGDPLDIPCASGESIEPHHTPLLLPLRNLALSGTEILYIVGNHDIGIAGLRIEPALSSSNIFSGVIIRYPYSLVEQARKTYLLEHGDYFEPFWADTILALMKYTFRILFRRGPRDLVRVSSRIRQRRAPHIAGVPPKQKPGVINKPPSFFDRLFRRYPERIIEFKQLNWRRAAQNRLKFFQKRGVNLTGIIFGHTHLPDEKRISDETVYYNSGSWGGDLPCCSYLVIKSDGNLKRRCFWEKKRGKDLTTETCDLMKCAKDLFKPPEVG